MKERTERAHTAYYDLAKAAECALLAFWASDPVYLARHLNDLDTRFRKAAEALGYDLVERVASHDEAAALMPERPAKAPHFPTASELDSMSMREGATA